MPARARPARLADPLADLAQLVLSKPPDELAAWLSTRTPEDAALVEQLLAEHSGAGWRTDPATFANHLDPAYRLWRYVQLLGRKYRDAVEGRSKRQLWNLPARYGKSLLASQWGPLWALDRTGGRARSILISYGKQLATENAMGVRERLDTYADLLTDGCRLAPGRRRMDRFRTIAGGGVLAAGATGAVRGFGAGEGGGLHIDDPFKDWQQAHSEHYRELIWNQYRGTWLDRLDDESAFIIVVHHRVHEEDLTGKLLAEDLAQGTDKWEHVVLPALAPERGPDDPPDPLGRQPGEPLEPERFSKPFIVELRAGMGSYLASALQDQDPTPEEGNDLRRSWFQLYVATEAEAVNSGGAHPMLPPRYDQALTSWDLKLKDNQQGDYVVGQAWRRVGADYYLVGQLRGQWGHAMSANAMALLAVRHPECTAHVVEQAGAYTEVTSQLRKPQPDYVVTPDVADQLGMTGHEVGLVQQLRRQGLAGILPHPPMADKAVRARLYIAPAAEARNVWLPAYADYTPALLNEYAAFPNGTHDDQVDATSQALQRMGSGSGVVAAAQGQLPRKPQARVGGTAGLASAAEPPVAVVVPASGSVGTSAARGRLGR